MHRDMARKMAGILLTYLKYYTTELFY